MGIMQQSWKFSWSFSFTTLGSKCMSKERRRTTEFWSSHTFILWEHPSHCSLCVWFIGEFSSPSDSNSDQTAIPNKAGSKGKERGKEKESGLRGRRGESERTMCKNEKKEHPEENHSHVTQRLATGASIRQCHAYNYVCTAWGSPGDAGKTSVVVSPRILHQPPQKNDSIQINATQVRHPCAPFSPWRTAPLLHRILSSECLIQLASQ